MTVPRFGVRIPAMTQAGMTALERWIVGWGTAIANRAPICGAPGMSCGGGCRRPAGHEPPCWCEGVDDDGEETCPA